MKRTIYCLGLCLMLVGLLVACGSGAADPAPTGGNQPPAAPTASLENVVIKLQRTVCFGTCPAYTVTITGDGSVVYQGEQFVAVEGEQRTTIPPEKVRELVDAANKADFFNLQDRYEGNVTDLPSTTTEITIDGKTKSVFNYFGAPQALIDLENKIDEIAGTAQWVAMPAQ